MARAKAIMVQGTASNAGKSILVTGLCRIFKQDGYKVAPFKAQNMALNSFITKEGLEMGRAQVAQAEAAGLEPNVLMNPVLLKPTGDTKSQVIVCGEVWKDLSARDYYKEKAQILPSVHQAYDRLAQENDIIVLEGAGSPAEVNLRSEDIVNMYMAGYAKAPVLLAGDIERGGVFASLVGSMVLFTEEERDMVAGFIINKFRGDVSILEPGLDILTEKTGKPVFGVMPYIDIDIDDEDSLTDKFHRRHRKEALDIVIIRIPHLANFTDFGVFESLPNLQIRYVDNKDDIGAPDMILMGGSKNTMGDLLWMRQNGIEAKILQEAKKGTPIIGLCGGYQMLGRSIADPDNTEFGGEVRGLGLLPVRTVFEKQKIRTRVHGKFLDVKGPMAYLSGMEIEGYETHMGRTYLDQGYENLVQIETLEGEKKLDGCQVGSVYGTYVHGLFDAEGIATQIGRYLMEAKGMDSGGLDDFNLAAYKEGQYDKLAQAMRQALDIDAIYEAMGLDRKQTK